MKPTANISVISSTLIHPTTAHAPPTTTPLSLIDATVARFTPCGAIWYFPSPSPSSWSSESLDILAPETLQTSLQHTLTAYPQWAGQLRMTPYVRGLPQRKNRERYGRMEVRYGRDEDPGVAFVVARAECDMELAVPGGGKGGLRACDDMLREDVLLPSTRLAGYMSGEDHSDPSVAVQITRFACGGTAVGIQMAHCLADAISLSTFVHDWSATHEALVSGSALPVLRPVFEPWVLDERATKSVDDVAPNEEVLQKAYALPLHRYDWWFSDEDSGFGPGAHTIPEPLREEYAARRIAERGSKMQWSTYDTRAPVSHAIIHYTSEELKRIWTTAAASSDADGNTKMSISRHDALVAHVWMLINRARGPENGNVDSEVHCDITLGLRTRVNPPLPPSSLGSPLQIAHTTLPWSVASSPDALPRIASSIKTTISFLTPAAVGAQIYATAYEITPQRLWQAFLGREHVIVTSWAHTGLYECGFGTGQTPRYVHPIMPLVDGCMQVMEARPVDAKADGGKWYDDGVDVAIYLEKEAMGRLLNDERIWL